MGSCMIYKLPVGNRRLYTRLMLYFYGSKSSRVWGGGSVGSCVICRLAFGLSRLGVIVVFLR